MLPGQNCYNVSLICGASRLHYDVNSDKCTAKEQQQLTDSDINFGFIVTVTQYTAKSIASTSNLCQTIEVKLQHSNSQRSMSTLSLIESRISPFR